MVPVNRRHGESVTLASSPMSHRLDRYEKKFVVTHDKRRRLLDAMAPHLRVDANTGVDSFYPIVSLYYDNRERDFYWERYRNLGSRRKLRVRIYGSRTGGIPPTSFIEVKHKYEGRGVKRRLLIPLEAALALGEGRLPAAPLGFADLKVAREVTTLVASRQLEPVCVMRYDRQAFAGTDEETDLRVTFDAGIRYRLDRLLPEADDADFAHRVIDEDTSVMEIKFTGALPYWLSLLLGRFGCLPVSFSKYSTALEQGDPVLRGAPYRRVALRPETLLPTT